MRVEGDYEEIARFRDSFMAQLWAGRLKAEGISAVVEGDLRQDEWAKAQELLGTGSIRVFARSDQAVEARAILRPVDQATIVERD